jgi:hypothetical protein
VLEIPNLGYYRGRVLAATAANFKKAELTFFHFSSNCSQDHRKEAAKKNSSSRTSEALLCAASLYDLSKSLELLPSQGAQWWYRALMGGY